MLLLFAFFRGQAARRGRYDQESFTVEDHGYFILVRMVIRSSSTNRAQRRRLIEFFGNAVKMLACYAA